jgi:16S rRNA (cytidine1402-2'-O)-methyltransferase
MLEGLKILRSTLVIYESPYRVEKLLAELQELYPNRQVVLARELTKKFEEYLRGTSAELLQLFKQRAVRGEFVVLIQGAIEVMGQ